MTVISEKLQRLLKKLSFKTNVDHHSSYAVLESTGEDDKQCCSPKGFIPIYVGEKRKRYLVPTAAANSPAFVAMLEKYQDDITRFGPLTVPCSTEAFEHVLRRAHQQMRLKIS